MSANPPVPEPTTMRPMNAAPRIRTRWLITAAVLALAACAGRPTPSPRPTAGSNQLVLVTTPGWDASQATVRRYERSGDRWQPVGAAWPAIIGRSGAAWGLGRHPDVAGTPVKREGDGRAPAGVFAIGTAFGYGETADTALPYAPMTGGDWCIDVPGSTLYNRIVNVDEVGAAAIEGSTEPMRRDLHKDGDGRYVQGFVIEHNTAAVPQGGSCIFAHVWKTPDTPTAGCTAMDADHMQALLAWLDPAARPLLVLLPEAEHARFHATWGLPAPAGD